MPRPADNYTHSQFEPVESDNQGETVQCKHCRNWTGSIKVLNRKKDHLMRCTQYSQWRAAGNGQDLAPPNKYNKRDSASSWRQWDGENGAVYGEYDSPYRNDTYTQPPVYRGRNIDVGRYYDEWSDESTGQKCTRVRCRSCGFMRAKNTTRQVEHLLSCGDFLDSPEGHDALTRGEIELIPPVPPMANMMNNTIERVPNGPPSSQPRPVPNRNHMPPPRGAPSLANHLLNKNPERLKSATQHQFLSHAGCGTLSASALSNWLGQNAHLTRAMVSFVGSLIGKVRLPETQDTRQHSLYRAMDLLISAVGNLRKELSFLEETRRKYNLEPDNEPLSHHLKSYIDLLSSVSDPRASLLEGLMVLWATENFYCLSWQYASTFVHTMPSSNYSVPSYLAPNQNPWSTFETPTGGPGGASGNEAQINALRDALIPNWSSRDFIKFVEACKAIVDELANAQTTGSGKEELERCEMQFSQSLFLWERTWPDIDGMGQQSSFGDANNSTPPIGPGPSSGQQTNPGTAGIPRHTGGGAAAAEGLTSITAKSSSSAGVNHHHHQHHHNHNHEDVDDDPDDDEDDDDELIPSSSHPHDQQIDTVDSPYGGTGLGVVAAANRA